MSLERLRVDGARLRGSLEEMAQIGGTPGGGVTRLTLSDEDRQARDLFVSWLKELNLEITVDEMGNIFGRRPGKDNNLPSGGLRFPHRLPAQGRPVRRHPVGSLGALEALRTMADNGVETLRPVTIVDWTNEEGSRFPPAMVGSGVWGRGPWIWRWA